MVVSRLHHSYERLLSPLLKLLCRLRVRPNTLTLSGLLVNGAAGFLLAVGKVRWGGVLILLAGGFDALDGPLARYSGQKTRFGAFLDSTVDRYSDLVLLLGILIFFLQREQAGYAVLTVAVLAGFFMVSYTRARAESLIPRCNVGLMERAERLLLLALGALLNALPAFLWLLAFLSHGTALQRIHYTWKQLRPERGSQERGETHDSDPERTADGEGVGRISSR